ncbi:MAG: hypothetical protein KA765_17635 [Thermoflexales bacterium]|nr:hypothetical protein [Thermoflexales bacterium]
MTQRDALLITYGDQLREANVSPLRTLADFCEQHLMNVVSGIHILPFYPYSSDDGFSVIDYTEVDPALGDWSDVARLGEHFNLMFDGVINHISAQSAWFQAFLRDEVPYRDYFITVEGEPDLSQVVRPRALPLLTTFAMLSGDKSVWTTFSADQIDLNYSNPDVLLALIDVLLQYVAQGAQFIRLDAIAYLWKEIGTSCIHLPQTHRVIQLLRAVLDQVAPQVSLITETNVPHVDNVSYFGDGHNEAQLVYNFALPPLMLHTLHTGDARALTEWIASPPGPLSRNRPSTPLRSAQDADFGRGGETAFFNFLASHDGIGLNPARGILSDAEIAALVNRVVAHGGRVSYKHNADGSRSPYELNINYFDALSDPYSSESIDVQIDRFIVAHASMLALSGMPGIYFHSLFGSRGWPEGVALTGQNRTINRQKFDRVDVERELGDPSSRRSRVFNRLKQLLEVRAASTAFAPDSPQAVLHFQSSVLALLRGSSEEQMLCLHNVSAQPQVIQLEALWRGSIDLIAGQVCDAVELTLAPYQILWLRHHDR